MGEHVAHTRSQIPLQLDSALDDGATGPARTLQLLTELFQELRVLGQPVDNSDGLTTASLLLHPHLRYDPRRDRGISGASCAALAVALRPATHRTFAGGFSRVHQTRVVLESHRPSVRSFIGMALTATIYNFDVEFADTDRHVYETLALRVARHPSESEEFLVARVIAYLLEFTEGIEFSPGVSTPDEPAIAVRDLTGTLQTWIDIGTPDAGRLHKASKLAARVVVYTHKDATQFLKQLAGKTIYSADTLELYAIDRALVSALVARLERRVAFTMSVSDRELYVSVGSDQITGSVVRLRRDA